MIFFVSKRFLSNQNPYENIKEWWEGALTGPLPGSNLASPSPFASAEPAAACGVI